MKIWFTQCAVVVASSLIVPLAGLAQSALPAKSGEDAAVIMPTFTIQSETESGYAATNSISATKVATELKKMPVSIDVLTEQLFKDYGLTEIYDIIGLFRRQLHAARGDGQFGELHHPRIHHVFQRT